MTGASVVVLGGGLSGAAAAYTLGLSGVRDVTVLESGASLGGLAGSFERDGHFYPLGYHHILHRDRTLLFFLQKIGALCDVRWRRIRMLFHLGGESYDLRSLAGFLRFPMMCCWLNQSSFSGLNTAFPPLMPSSVKRAMSSFRVNNS